MNLVGARCGEKGVFAGGFSANTLRIGPALNITEAHVEEAIAALDYALVATDQQCV